MKKLNSPTYFKLFLESQGMNPNDYEYMGKDCESYKIKNIHTGVVGDIRY
jgi:hypothetical protein